MFLSPVSQIGGAERILLDLIASLRQTSTSIDELHLLLPAEGTLAEAARDAGAVVHAEPMPAALARLGESGWHGGTFAAENRSHGRDARVTGAPVVTRASRPCKRRHPFQSISLTVSNATLAPRLVLRALLALPAAVQYAHRLRRHISRINPEVVHSNGVKMHLFSRVAVPPRIRVIWHIHDFLGQRPLIARILRWFAGRVSVSVAVSQAVAEDVRAVLPGIEVRTVLNAIDIEHFSPGQADGAVLDRLADMAQADAGMIRVGLVATYARWKGQDLFLAAAARVLKNLKNAASPPVRFYVIGGPIYVTAGSQFSREELCEQSRMLGIESHVTFIDFQSDPAAAFRALDIVVHASTRPEPFGLTITEAMSCGRAVVVSRGGGAGELFTDGVDAIGFAPGDAADLARAIELLMNDPPQRVRLGQAARKTAITKFDRRRLGPQFAAIYRGVIAG